MIGFWDKAERCGLDDNADWWVQSGLDYGPPKGSSLHWKESGLGPEMLLLFVSDW